VYFNKYLRSRIMSRVTELLGSRHPIIQGAMGIICNPELVAAVSNAGAFGLIATAFATDPEAVRSQIRATRELTADPFGVNLQVMNPLTGEFVRVLADEGIRVVTVSGGSPKALIPVLHDCGIRVIVLVSSVEVARKAESLGADAIVAEGSESGGIQGMKGVSTMVLVPAVVDAVGVPVIAAGGIADSRGYRAALALGAEGVQVGTRFIATTECIAHENYKSLIINSSDTRTGLINMGRIQVRALITPLVERAITGEPLDPGRFDGEAMVKSWIKGDIEASSLPAGEVAGLIHSIASVQEIIDEMVG
jgi:NAD(P)H-dependent flavin oxidoreductase YrpB (nitropropane dioxygenase family)